MPSHLTLHEAERLYERLTELPSVTGAEVVSLGSHQQAQIHLSVTDHALLEKAKHVVQVDLRGDDDGSATSMIAVDGAVKMEWGAMLRPEVRVVLKEKEKGEGKRWVEVWKEGLREHYVDVGGVHGAFATDATFGTSSATVDPSTGRVSILYQASAKHPKDDEADGKGSTRDPLDRFQYRAPMGERFAFDFQPRLFLLRVGGGLPANLQEIRASEARPDRLLAQGVLTLNGKHIVATAYDAMAGGRRLGQVYCTNRPSSMWAMPVPKDITGGEDGKTAPLSARDKVKAATVIVMEKAGGAQQLSTKGRATRSPRAAPTTTYSSVIWLETPEGGAHQQASTILTAIIDDDSKAQIDEVIPLDYKDDLDSNIGLYIDQLPREPFFNSAAQDAPLFGLTTISGSKRIVRTFDLAGKKQEAHGLEPGETLSWSFLAGGQLGYLAVRSGMNSPPEVVYAAGDGSPVRVLWQVKLPSSSSDAHLSEAKVQILRIDGTDSASPSDGPIEAILFQPPNTSTTNPPPCILLPHGGPHGTTTTDFAPGSAALCLAGYSILAPNYHGSLGRSPAFVDSLIGKCGTLDIEDCMATLRYAISKGYASAENVYVSGGSHGGFIAGHLAGREPKAWKAVAMRNPVTHIGGQHITSDIPDWCASETGHPYSFNDPPAYPSPEIYANLTSVSPLQYHSAIEAPILLLLGDSDQRVPPEQGLALYHALRKRGESKVGLCWFQGDCHALDTVEGARGSWLGVWRWFEEVGRGRGVE